MNKEIIELNSKINNAGSFQKLIDIPEYILSNNIKITFNIIDYSNIKITFYYGYLFPLYIYNLPHDIIRHILLYSKEYIIIEFNVYYDNNFPYHNHIISLNNIKNNINNGNNYEEIVYKIIKKHNNENEKQHMNSILSSESYTFNLDRDISWLFIKIPFFI